MKSFNLTTQPWIPIQGGQEISLLDVFQNQQTPMLVGSPIEKLALFKLLLAVGHAAFTPDDEEHWFTIGLEGFKHRVVQYLRDKQNVFDLYGQAPFLQYPEIKGKCRDASITSFLPHVASGNSTILFNSQKSQPLDDGQKARLLISQMGFAFGGKKADNSFSLSPGYEAKGKSAKSGPSLGFIGFLHNFWIDEGSLPKSIWMNLYSKQSAQAYLNKEVGDAPWDVRPAGEDCSIAKRLKKSYMGRLIPLGRLSLIEEDNFLITEGIAHPSYIEGESDPSIALKPGKPKPKILWVNPELKPWRQLPGLLNYLGKGAAGYECTQLRFAASRFHLLGDSDVALWSCGTSVSSNAGEQYLTGKNDSVDSTVSLSTAELNDTWFDRLTAHFEHFEQMSRILYSATQRYYSEMSADGADQAARCSNTFWLGLETHLDEVLGLCKKEAMESDKCLIFRQKINRQALDLYDRFAPKETSRQIESWAKNRPDFNRPSKKTEKKQPKGKSA